jgi:hypothetical protein
MDLRRFDVGRADIYRCKISWINEIEAHNLGLE